MCLGLTSSRFRFREDILLDRILVQERIRWASRDAVRRLVRDIIGECRLQCRQFQPVSSIFISTTCLGAIESTSASDGAFLTVREDRFHVLLRALFSVTILRVFWPVVGTIGFCI